MALLNQKLAFAKQIDNLKKKGEKLDKMCEFVNDLEDNTQINTRDDYLNMEKLIKDRRQDLDEAFVVDQNRQNAIYRKCMKGMDSEAQNFIDAEIEHNIMYFSHEYKKYQQAYEELQ